jgi:SecD/SecF fusion protein
MRIQLFSFISFFLFTTLLLCSCSEKEKGIDMQVTFELSQKQVLTECCLIPGSEEFKSHIRQTDSAFLPGNLSYFEHFINSWKKTYPEKDITYFFFDGPNYDQNNTLEYLNAEFERKKSLTFEILRKRLEEAGVEELVFNDSDVKGRYTINLKGVKQPEAIETIISQKAILTFYETFELSEIADRILTSESLIVEKFLPFHTNASPDTSKVVGLLDGDDDLLLTSEDSSAIENQKQHPLLSKLFLNIRSGENGMSEYIEGSVVGHAKISDTAEINAMLDFLTDYPYPPFPRDLSFVWGSKPENEESGLIQLYALKVNHIMPILDGSVVVDASVQQSNGMNEIRLEMNSEGALKFKHITQNNINRSVAIVLDGSVLIAPRVMQVIEGGSISISGNFTEAEAKDMALLIKYGKLPLDVNVIEIKKLDKTTH